MKFAYPPLVLCSAIFTLLPLFASFTVIRHLRTYSTSLILLFAFFAFAAAAEIVLYLLSFQGKQSAWLFHVYTGIEYVLITFVFAGWQTNSIALKLMRTSIPFYFFCFVMIKASGLEGFEAGSYNNLTRPLATLLLTTFSFLTLQALWRHSPANLTSDYRFWMLLAMLLYYSTSLVLSAFMLTRNHDLLVGLFKIHAVANITCNLLFTIGIFQLRRAQQAALQ